MLPQGWAVLNPFLIPKNMTHMTWRGKYWGMEGFTQNPTKLSKNKCANKVCAWQTEAAAFCLGVWDQLAQWNFSLLNASQGNPADLLRLLLCFDLVCQIFSHFLIGTPWHGFPLHYILSSLSDDVRCERHMWYILYSNRYRPLGRWFHRSAV